ncbi:MAG: lysine exporter LysO family protein [Oscillatoriales cyanobacterium RM2_1_1]|nr:lysine exporter LysO family protein [Oscillatoriales cyanobacterium SM2_3_0]NJO44787.1 lysine exporter LysO family protein [Oscillatoriales cyanobacterium RM2_1_1]
MSPTLLVPLVIILGSLAVLVVQNFSPALSLIFLGNQSLSLPLSLWILIAIAGGFLSSLVIAALFQMAAPGSAPSSRRNQSPSESVKRPVQPTEFVEEAPTASSPYHWSDYAAEAEPEPESDAAPSPYGFISEPPVPPQPRPKEPRSTAGDDWETEIKPIRPWDAGDREVPLEPSEQPQEYPGDSSYDSSPDGYEVEQRPQTQNWSGSTYSYGYREPEPTSQSKTSEPVYDANYRVIIPPASAPTQIQSDPIQLSSIQSKEEDEDWGFDEEDEDLV